MTMLAFLRLVQFDLIRFFYRLQCMSFMPRLPTAFLSAGLTQTLRLLLEPITRRWFATVAAVLGNLIFQSLDMFCQLPERFVKQFDHSFFALIVGNADFFIGRQADWFHAYIVPGFCDFDNV